MTNLEGKEAPSVENKHDLPGEKREESCYRTKDELEAEVAEAGVTQDQKGLGAIAEPKHKQRQGQRVTTQGLNGSKNIFHASAHSSVFMCKYSSLPNSTPWAIIRQGF